MGGESVGPHQLPAVPCAASATCQTGSSSLNDCDCAPAQMIATLVCFSPIDYDGLYHPPVRGCTFEGLGQERAWRVRRQGRGLTMSSWLGLQMLTPDWHLPAGFPLRGNPLNCGPQRSAQDFPNQNLTRNLFCEKLFSNVLYLH